MTMIRHIVIFQLDESQITTTKIATIKQELEALMHSIPELIKMEVGLNANPDEKQHLVLTADFSDWEGLELYAQHPQHQAVAAKIRPLATGRTCVDYEI